MSLLLDLFNESAAAGSTGAGSVASSNGSLFGGDAKDVEKVERKRNIIMKKIGYKPVIRRPMTFAESLSQSTSAILDPADVLSKIDAAERDSTAREDTEVFGLEDESGQIIKVYVKSDQSEEFEVALATMLDGYTNGDDDQTVSVPEIAEVIHKLKDNFDIVDVEWGSIATDEEEEDAAIDSDVPVNDKEEGGEPSAEGGDLGGMDGESGELGAEGGAEGDLEMSAGDDSGAASVLDKVIDMMRADADAKTAEAKAREAEANAREAEAAAAAVANKVKQEEQIMDMEAHNRAKSDKEKEAKKLAQLAKYQHEMQTEGLTIPMCEAKDLDKLKKEKKLSMEQLATLIFYHLQKEGK